MVRSGLIFDTTREGESEELDETRRELRGVRRQVVSDEGAGRTALALWAPAVRKGHGWRKSR